MNRRNWLSRTLAFLTGVLTSWRSGGRTAPAPEPLEWPEVSDEDLHFWSPILTDGISQDEWDARFGDAMRGLTDFQRQMDERGAGP